MWWQIRLQASSTFGSPAVRLAQGAILCPEVGMSKLLWGMRKHQQAGFCHMIFRVCPHIGPSSLRCPGGGWRLTSLLWMCRAQSSGKLGSSMAGVAQRARCPLDLRLPRLQPPRYATTPLNVAASAALPHAVCTSLHITTWQLDDAAGTPENHVSIQPVPAQWLQAAHGGNFTNPITAVVADPQGICCMTCSTWATDDSDSGGP